MRSKSSSRRRDHLLALDRLADARKLVADTRREFVLLRVGSILHPRIEPLQHRVVLAVEEREQLADELVVLRVVDRVDARRRALLDVGVEARPAEAMVPIELRLRARPDRERPQQEVERLPDRVRMRVRTEVAHALALGAAQHHRPGPLLVESDREVRVRLVVLQPDVEARPVLLDEVVLEEERLDLVAGDDPLDPLGGQHHLTRAFLEQMGLEEVVREPGPQALGLPDVDDPALGVEELVRPRCVWDRADFGTGDHAPFSRARGARECFHSD